jgi:hypothetical protein
LRNLRRLRILKGGIDAAGAAALAHARGLPALQVLDISWNDIGTTGAAALIASDWLGGLMQLVLDGNRLNKKDQAALKLHFGERLR